MIVGNTAGVFRQIIDKSQYPETVGVSTSAAIAFTSERGIDNTWILISGGPKELLETFGQLDVVKQGQAYLNAYRFSSVSGALYAMRVLPNADDPGIVNPARFAHIVLTIAKDADHSEIQTVLPIYYNNDKTTSNTVNDDKRKEAPTRFTTLKFTLPDGSTTNTNIYEYIASNFTLDDTEKTDIQNDTNLKAAFLDPKGISELDATLIPFTIFYAVGRGDWYNRIGLRIAAVPNEPEVFLLEVYVNTDNGPMTVESFYVSWNPSIVDGTGETKFVDHVVNTYSKYIRSMTNKDLLPILNAPSSTTVDGRTLTVIEDILRNTAFAIDTYNTSYPLYDFQLMYGTDGDLYQNGLLNRKIYTQCLLSAYNGLYDSNILNKEEIVIDLLIDANHDISVKQAMVKLAEKRGDCFVVLDLLPAGDVNGILDTMKTKFSWLNTWMAAVYAPFTVIKDPMTGQEIKATPSYHACYVYPLNDQAGFWKAPAGLNRGTLTDIVRPVVDISALPDVLEKLYTNRINPIVKKRGVYLFYGNETAQRVSSALSDINVVRTLLRLDRDISRFCDQFIFEDNTPDTWLRIEEGVREILTRYKKEGALYWYDLEVGATEYEIKHHIVHVNVYVKIVRAIKVVNLVYTVK